VTTVEARAHSNLCGWVRFLARLDRGELLDEGGIVAARGARDFPGSRYALRSEDPGTADAYGNSIDEFLLAHGQTACAMLRVGADDDLSAPLQARGFREFANEPQMVCENAPGDREPAPGVTVRIASTPVDALAYARIAGEAFAHLSIPADYTEITLDNPEVMLGSDVVIALADVDGEPVAGACVVMVGERPEGYVAWVSCADKARGRGLGDTVTRRVTNEAFARGADIVSLEASPYGEHTYARMGYREVTRYRLLIKF
jgi:ribosomal protein S18 acetylase RimI-like enzyme